MSARLNNDPTRSRQLGLASGSAFRQQLLGMLGLPHHIKSNDFAEEEVLWSDFIEPKDYIATIATGKALAAADKLLPAEKDNTTILAGDLNVFLDRKNYGKPRSFAEARQYLAVLQGQEHIEVAAVAIWSSQLGLNFATAQSKVYLPPLTAAELEHYLSIANPLTKAGGFCLRAYQQILYQRSSAVQLEGEVSTVLGLPVAATMQLLSRYGWVAPVTATALEDTLRQEVGLV